MSHGDITHVEIPVSDFSAATQFYGTVFGWNIAESPGFEGYPMWRAPNGISGGALVERTAEFTQPRSTVEVDSIDETLARAESSGGRVRTSKTAINDTSWWAVFEDPDGNLIEVYESAA